MSFIQEKLAGAGRRLKYFRDGFLHRDAKKFTARPGAARIVCYHGICLDAPHRFNASFTTQRVLGEHLRFYKQYFHVVSLDELFEGKISKTRFNVCITFDDGHRNNLIYALPLLERYETPAAFFITSIRSAGYDVLWNDSLSVFSKYGPSDLSCEGRRFHKNRHDRYVAEDGTTLQEWLLDGGFDAKAECMRQLGPLADFRSRGIEDYWLQMTETEIAQLSSSPFVSIGAHGHYHNDLTRISTEAAGDELLSSKSWLEGIMGREVVALAFPYGRYNPELKALARSAGYRQLLALDFLEPAEDRQDQDIRERMVVNPYISVHNQMRALVRGKYY